MKYSVKPGTLKAFIARNKLKFVENNTAGQPVYTDGRNLYVIDGNEKTGAIVTALKSKRCNC